MSKVFDLVFSVIFLFSASSAALADLCTFPELKPAPADSMYAGLASDLQKSVLEKFEAAARYNIFSAELDEDYEKYFKSCEQEMNAVGWSKYGEDLNKERLLIRVIGKSWADPDHQEIVALFAIHFRIAGVSDGLVITRVKKGTQDSGTVTMKR